MEKKSAFDLFLAFSILAILLGIAIIIFIQIDRGYVISGNSDEADFKKLQQRLLLHLTESDVVPDRKVASIAKRQSGQASTSDAEPSRLPVADTTPLLRTLKLDSAEAQTQTNPSLVDAPAGNSYDDYAEYWLSRNPWSPDYQPPSAQH
jgi:hypothetical protein